jgi:hypothetical protein
VRSGPVNLGGVAKGEDGQALGLDLHNSHVRLGIGSGDPAFELAFIAGRDVISSAPATTWLLVRMYPAALTITPDPRLRSRCSRGIPEKSSPKNWRKKDWRRKVTAVPYH